MIKRKMLERQSLFGRKINSMAGYMNLESISKLGAKDAWIIRTKKMSGTDR